MISISKHMDEHDIAQEIRFERQIHKGSFLLLEGATDVKRFSQFLDEKACSIVNCYGRKKATKAIQILNEDGFQGAAALLDCDFDRILKRLVAEENMIFSEVHDFDLEWLSNDVLGKYLLQIGDPIKCAAIGNHEEILLYILKTIKPLSILRLLNSANVIRYKLSVLKIEDFYDGTSIDIDGMVDQVFEGRHIDPSIKSDLISKIKFYTSRNFCLFQISNGHDATTALGIALRDKLASRAKPQTWGSEIELHIRLAFTDKEFLSSSVYKGLAAWEGENPKFRILHSRFTSAPICSGGFIKTNTQQ